MNVMQNFTFRSMKRNKRRSIVTIIGVIISVAMMTAVTTFMGSFIDMLQRGTIADNGNWHAQIKQVQAQNMDAITKSDTIKSVVYSRNVGFAPLKGSANDNKPYLFVREYSENGFKQMSIRVTSGRLPQKNGEVLVSNTIDKSTGVHYKIGDTLDLTLGHRVDLEGKIMDENNNFQSDTDDSGQTHKESFVQDTTAKYTIVGFMDAPGYEQSWSAGCAVLGLMDVKTLTASGKIDLFITCGLDRSMFKTIPKLAEAAGVPAKNVNFNNELLRYYGVVSQDNVNSFFYIFASIILLIIIAASITLIYNAFAISVSERSKQLGLLASVGATRRQKRQSVYFEGFIIGLVGIPLGILLGIGGMAVTFAALSPILSSTLNFPAGISLDLVVSPLSVILAVAFSIVTIFISVWIPARRASKITPIDAIRQSGEVKLTRKNVKTSRLTRKIFGFESEIAQKNFKRYRRKYRATVISLTISLVLFLTVSTYADMMRGLSGATNGGYNFDIEVVYHKGDKVSPEALNKSIAGLDNVTNCAFSRELEGRVTLDSSKLTEYTKQYFGKDKSPTHDLDARVLCLDEKAFADYAKELGVNVADYTNPSSPKAILVNHGQDYFKANGETKKISGNILNIKAGESLNFVSVIIPENKNDDSNNDNQEIKSTPVAINIGMATDERPIGVYMQTFSYFNVVVSEPVWNALFANMKPEFLTKNTSAATYVTTDNDQVLEKQISGLAGAYGSVHNIKSAARNEANINIFMGVFIYGFIILISLICIANIFNTVSTNIALRRREFAMLRSVGMTPKGFNKMIRFESVLYGFKGLLYGLPLSFLIGLLLNKVQGQVLDTGLVIPWHSYIFAVVMILVIIFATMLYSTSKIKKENIIDAIKEENI